MVYRLIAIILFLTFSFTQSHAVGPEELQQRAEEAIRAWKKVQELEDRWAKEREKLLKEIEVLEAKRRNLLWRKHKLQRYIAEIKERITELQRRIRELKRINQELEPYLDETLKRLKGFVEEDLPFLKEERQKRLVALQEVLDGYDVGIAEKLRRVLEALRIEVEYGAEVEVTEERVELPEGPRVVQVLRLGRLALFCRTLDGKEIARFDPETAQWERLPGRFSRELYKAMEMAARRRAADLVRLPIGGLRR